MENRSEYQIRKSPNIETLEELEKLFSLSEEERLLYAQRIGLILYGYSVYSAHQEWIVYRSHNEMILLLNKLNRKYKKDITFEQLQQNPTLEKLCGMEQLEGDIWWRDFFQLGKHDRGEVLTINMEKKSGGRYFRIQCCGGCGWRFSTFVIVESGILYYRSNTDHEVKQFLHFGKDFNWKPSQYFPHFQIIIYSYHRKLTLRANNQTQYLIFAFHLHRQLNRYKQKQQHYRFNSFSPVRKANAVHYFVDGKQYFEALAKRLDHAKEEVFICGWWLSPEFHLVRPCNGRNLEYRVDRLLKRIASRGVSVYILVWFQSSFLTNDSAYVIQALPKLHHRIKVLRHPQIILPSFWSHHEKLVVVDQHEAFIGGMDICYGRYDDSQHRIDDNSVTKYPGIEYNNCRVNDFINVREYQQQNVPRNSRRLPWHDVAMIVKGEVVRDLSRHFIEYWNYASYQTHYAERFILTSKPVKKDNTILNRIKQFAQKLVQRKNQDFQKKSEEVKPQRTDQSRSKAEEILDMPVLKRKSRSQKPQIKKQIRKLEIFERFQIPLSSQREEARELKNFQSSNELGSKNLFEEDQLVSIQHEDKIIQEQMKEQKRFRNSLLEMANVEENIDRQEEETGEKFSDYLYEKHNQRKQKKKKIKLFETILQAIKQRTQEEEILPKLEENNNDCQVVRSVSQWSIGCKASHVQKSVSNAYLSMIRKAKRFIYIENQFFISATKEGGVVKNLIMQGIAERVEKAISEGQKFRVVIVMPLVPGFAGELDDPSATFPRVIMSWQYKTIIKGENSLFERIGRLTPNPHKYIEFYGLRNHGVINDIPQTEIVYLHSKLMIIDDKSLIMGSANINDRSMEGDRDSELCLIVDENSGKMSNKNINQGKIHEFRMKLWKQHWKLSQEECLDPLNQNIQQKMKNIAKTNTVAYRNIFGCYPDDKIKRIQQIDQLKKNPNLEHYEKEKESIVGHAVQFPLHFLEQEKMSSLHPNILST